jgi:hypothetical protein
MGVAMVWRDGRIRRVIDRKRRRRSTGSTGTLTVELLKHMSHSSSQKCLILVPRDE